MMRRVATLAVTAIVLAATACSDGGDDGAPAASSAPAGPKALELTASQTLHRVEADFQYGAFAISLGEAVYDEERDELYLGARVRNLASQWAAPAGEVFVEVSGGERYASWQAPRVPPGVVADVTLTVGRLEEDPFDGSTILWGRKDGAQVEIALSGDNPDLWRPTPVPLDEWAQIGKWGVHLTGAHLLNGSLARNFPPPPDQRVLRVDLDAYSTFPQVVNGFYTTEHVKLRWPDGTVVDPIAGSAAGVVEAWELLPAHWVELPVPADQEGDYELLINSPALGSLGVLRPELIEQLPVPFTIGELEPPPVEPSDGTDPPRPVLPAPDARPAGDEPAHEPVERDLDVGVVNVPGFLFEPTHLSWDPAARTAHLTGTATHLEPPSVLDSGLLATDPAFDMTSALTSGGRFFAGVPDGETRMDPGGSAEIRLEFLGVDALDLDDAGLYIGRGGATASSLPLGPDSTLPVHPVALQSGDASSPAAVAADWTVRAVGYRIGLLDLAAPPPPGYRLLEITFDVTPSPDATVKAFGLVFSPRSQLFLSTPEGYLVRGVADSSAPAFEPGSTQQLSVTWFVPESFTQGRLGVVLRGNDDGDVALAHEWVETTFAVAIGDSGVPPFDPPAE